ncbi:hypothetical protein QR680_007938 [Steinernema hermaphroditum]|uniref:Serpin domain-containing protein n=1 Tax=Steinernema hermaphroditum TaxID=289476 RepID=A0AA39IGX6_9BILA|nr:hypothetical protein QR680_007938 [Steinernema hermaphroditum]
MMLGGARGGTKEQLRTIIGRNVSDEEFHQAFKCIISALTAKDNENRTICANGLFVQEGETIVEDFQKLLEETYNVELENLNFPDANESVNKINRWVNQSTEEMEFMGPSDIEQNMKMLLVNAVYFKGRWTKPFGTEMWVFHVNHNETREVGYPEDVKFGADLRKK